MRAVLIYKKQRQCQRYERYTLPYEVSVSEVSFSEVI